MTSTRIALFVVAACVFGGLDGCSPPSGDASSRTGATVAELTVDDVVKMLDSGEADVYDANIAATRQKYGVVPGATLLTSSSQYDTSVLPSDLNKPLVFYCANAQCSASDAAATRAVQAGHTEVGVMRDGIEGWVAAGQKTDQPTS